MSKYIYLLVFDNTKEWHDPKCCSFYRHHTNSDMAGYVTAKAEMNMVSPDDIRMFIYESKKNWEEARRDWVSKVDWSLPCI